MTEPMREGLAPVIADGARVLLLGSFPSERSLTAGQYYANRRNQFWPLMAALFGVDAELPYEHRITALTGHGVALWDVVHSCRRAGSLDAKIDRKTLVVNDFDAFLAQNPGIERIFVNGSTAYELLQRHVTTELPSTRLPSSSGALPMSLADKLTQWRALL
ncbi:DNA-deoxyinosine glycosylase [Mycolicibacterium sp. 050158]|jgi:double-stranded uracil-DNA glycosylase|uniref:DNA-deoxyinosine glycosylase n=1 Tax=Mycolicibacterium sp. 050158 TaxID=3090602 RepID=UPI00299DE1EE|nr:DNA-deoxyinosine glycosylase [Mycolicibacterium sp. 050158]MDX1893025.1 DNA-deoxyinosine glycosylase [Mycolicibacterium sp. 050158]